MANISVRDRSNSVWFGLKAIWVASGDGWITKIDPKTHKVLGSAQVGSAAEQLRTGFGSVWVRADDRTLLRVDPATLTVTATHQLPTAPIPGGGIAIGSDSVWVANFGASTIWRILP